jgi:hypothetical protein
VGGRRRRQAGLEQWPSKVAGVHPTPHPTAPSHHLHAPVSLSPTPNARGTLAPGEYGLLTVIFTPRTAGTPTFRRFAVATPGGPPARLAARGEGEGPRLALSARALDFGDVRAGQAAAAVFYIENASAVPGAYEFADEGGGVFALSAPRGVVGPRSVTAVRAAFAPAVAANYWRRLVCAVKVGMDGGMAGG